MKQMLSVSSFGSGHEASVLGHMPHGDPSRSGELDHHLQNIPVTKNKAIFFVDMVDFTRTTSRMAREKIVELLKLYESLALPVLRRFGGKVVKSIGDAYLVLFDSPTNAVLAGLRLQETLADYNGRGNMPIRARIGISLGDVILERRDVFGEAVNLASRILTLAPPDDVYFSESVYHAMNPNEISCQDLGLFELKGISRKTRIFKSSKPFPARTVQATASPPVDTRTFFRPNLADPAAGLGLTTGIMYIMNVPASSLAALVLLCAFVLFNIFRLRKDLENQMRQGLELPKPGGLLFIMPLLYMTLIFVVMWLLGISSRALLTLGILLAFFFCKLTLPKLRRHV